MGDGTMTRPGEGVCAPRALNISIFKFENTLFSSKDPAFAVELKLQVKILFSRQFLALFLA